MASHQINFPQTTIAGGDRVSGGTIFPLLNVGFARINTIFYRFTCTAAVVISANGALFNVVLTVFTTDA